MEGAESAHEDLARAARVGERLAAELRATLALLPAQCRRAAGFSRELDLDRGTAARAVRTARSEGASAALDALLSAPGVGGLRKIVAAGRARGLSAETLDALERAIDAYAELIGRMGGSQAQLNARLAHMRVETDRPAARVLDERQRRSLYESAAAIVGRSCDVRTEVILTRPSATQAGAVERFWARGVIGYRGGPDAMPLVIGAAETAVVHEAGPGDLDEIGAAPGDLSAAVATEFTSSPPPIVTRRGEGNQAVLAIDPLGAAAHERADVVLMSERPDLVVDAREPIERDEIRTMVRNPTRTLVFDVYVHESLAGDRVPGVGVYLWSPAFHRDASSHWYDRLPHPPVLQLLGRGLANASSDAYERQRELAGCCFERADWNAEEFIGFRFQALFPVWGGCYCMRFRYADD